MPKHVALAGSVLYVADQTGRRVRQIDVSSRLVTTAAGSGTAEFADGGSDVAQFYKPTGIAATPNNMLVLITDTHHHRVRQFLPKALYPFPPSLPPPLPPWSAPSPPLVPPPALPRSPALPPQPPSLPASPHLPPLVPSGHLICLDVCSKQVPMSGSPQSAVASSLIPFHPYSTLPPAAPSPPAVPMIAAAPILVYVGCYAIGGGTWHFPRHHQ